MVLLEARWFETEATSDGPPGCLSGKSSHPKNPLTSLYTCTVCMNPFANSICHLFWWMTQTGKSFHTNSSLTSLYNCTVCMAPIAYSIFHLFWRMTQTWKSSHTKNPPSSLDPFIYSTSHLFWRMTQSVQKVEPCPHFVNCYNSHAAVKGTSATGGRRQVGGGDR